MRIDKNPTESNAKINNETSDKKQHLITDVKFQLLKQCQKNVYDVNESFQSIRKFLSDTLRRIICKNSNQNLQQFRTVNNVKENI